MKPNNPNFFTNFSEDKMTESVKLADYRNSAHDGHFQQFEKYAAGNQDSPEPLEEREQKLLQNQGIQLGTNARQIKTEYSQVSHIESGFQKFKTNQAEMLKQLRSEYDNLKNLPMDRQKQSAPSSNSDTHRNHTEEDASSVPSSKSRRDLGQREQRFWNVERKQYESVITNCQQKIEELLHAEMQYKRTIHELRTSAVAPKVASDSKADQLMIRELQNNLREEKQKNKYLQLEVEKLKSNNKQQVQKMGKIESQLSERNRESYKYDEEKRKWQDAIRLEKEKVMNSEIEKRKIQMQLEIMEKDKDLEINRLLKLIDHDKYTTQFNSQNMMKKYEEEIELKDRRYRLLLQEYEKLKKDHHDSESKHTHESSLEMLNTFEQMKALISQNRSSQNEEFTKTIGILIKRMEDASQESAIDEYIAKNERLEAQIKILKAELEKAHFKGIGSGDGEKIKKIYEAEILALKDTINILEKKIKQKAAINQPSPASQKPAFDQTSGYENRLRDLELQIKQKALLLEQYSRTANLYREKWEAGEGQIRDEKRRLDEVRFELEKSRKEHDFKIMMIQREQENTIRLMRQDLDKANQNAGHWRKQFESMRRFYEQKIQEKNRLIESSSNSVDLVIMRKEYEEHFERSKTEYETQIAQLIAKLQNHPSSSQQCDELRRQCTQWQIDYFDLKRHLERTRYLNSNVDHLWNIKETQYNNINAIMHQIGRNRQWGHEQHQPASWQGQAPPKMSENLSLQNRFSNQSERVDFSPGKNYKRTSGGQDYNPIIEEESYRNSVKDYNRASGQDYNGNRSQEYGRASQEQNQWAESNRFSRESSRNYDGQNSQRLGNGYLAQNQASWEDSQRFQRNSRNSNTLGQNMQRQESYESQNKYRESSGASGMLPPPPPPPPPPPSFILA